ncbi:DUF1048 domain-containing protein [Lapidilactobacillus achengensis]|uniref:DUF1048 domain-containing protein n=1 Tax=Lapidilactobacillus achengensis TaxID=2486000 RepID=A0ABW1UQC1_9LACO|nr:DUF1048 domain-containing protein [Lapidilactobacillus achengensis]
MSLKQAWAEKKEWRELQKRVAALPTRYAIVYQEIQKYLMKVDPINLTNDFQPLNELLDLFEDGARRHKDVLAVTGQDVAAFADGMILTDHPFLDAWRQQVNDRL